MIFTNGRKFKNVLFKHSPQIMRDYKLAKNDFWKLKTICKGGKCGWRVLCSIDGKSKSWVVKKYESKHDCNLTYNNSKINYKFVADHFVKKRGISIIKMKLIEMKEAVKKDLCMDVSLC